MGSLFSGSDGRYRLLAPTETGPQPGNPGGELALWESDENRFAWRRTKQVTRGSDRNHTYVRRTVGAGERFAAFWADGNPRKVSESSLYFSDSSLTEVWRLPQLMSGDWQMPERIG